MLMFNLIYKHTHTYTNIPLPTQTIFYKTFIGGIIFMYNFKGDIYMTRNRKDLKKELDKITDTVNIELTNQVIEMSGELEKFQLTKKTLNNIAKWALDGKSQFEIAQNLELSSKEWAYLVKVCPSILLVMQHSQAYADIVVAGTLYQTAIGGHEILVRTPLKIKEYNEEGKAIGEHVEIVEYKKVQEPNPYLLKYLAEHKLSEQFGDVKTDNSKEQREVVEVMSKEELDLIEKLGANND